MGTLMLYDVNHSSQRKVLSQSLLECKANVSNKTTPQLPRCTANPERSRNHVPACVGWLTPPTFPGLSARRGGWHEEILQSGRPTGLSWVRWHVSLWPARTVPMTGQFALQRVILLGRRASCLCQRSSILYQDAQPWVASCN